jgi:soluble lytic murein transglycosylase
VHCGACAERVAGPPPAQSTASPSPVSAPVEAASAVVEAAPPPPAPVLEKTWQEAIRVEEWTDAATLMDALPDDEQARPANKYARARVALALGDGEKAVALLEGLDEALPLIAIDIARYRAEAELIAGPYLPAAEYFAKASGKVKDLARAAEAYAKANQPDKARSFADRAVQVAQRAKSKRDEATARMARARIRRAKLGDAAAEPDLRWVAVHAPHTLEGQGAIATLDRIKHPLTPKERLEVVDALLDVASPDAAPEIERVAKALPPASAADLHARATAFYRARSYDAAAKTFDEAASKHSGHEAEDLYYAARSLARVGKADEAAQRLEEVIKRFKGSSFADKASYYAGRLALDAGKFDDAAKAYARYLGDFRRGERRDDAEYERALAELSSSEPGIARVSLKSLERRAKSDDVNKLKELEGVAALRAGQRDDAIALWLEVARAQPMSWAALASRARLAAAGAAVPPLLEPPRGAAPAPLSPELPGVVAMLASVGLDADAEAYLTQREHETTAGYGDRASEALCSLYGKLSRAKRRFRLATHAVSSSMLYRAPSIAERWAWECVYPQPFAAHVRGVEEQRAIPHGLLYAVMRQESAFDPAVVSPAAAIGLLQLMPGTAKQCATELDDADFDPAKLTSPDVNLRIGAFYLGKLLKMFDGNVLYAAAAYNAGPKAVASWIGGKEVDSDLWVARIPYDETRAYVAKVAGNLARYQYLQGGEAAVAPIPLAMNAATVPEDAY